MKLIKKSIALSKNLTSIIKDHPLLPPPTPGIKYLLKHSVHYNKGELASEGDCIKALWDGVRLAQQATSQKSYIWELELDRNQIKSFNYLFYFVGTKSQIKEILRTAIKLDKN